MAPGTNTVADRKVNRVPIEDRSAHRFGLDAGWTSGS
jgi:hypothetical protein